MDPETITAQPQENFVHELMRNYRPGSNQSLRHCFETRNLVCKPIILISFEFANFLFEKNDLERVLVKVGGLLSFRLFDNGRYSMAMLASFEDCFAAISLLDKRKVEREGKVDFLKAGFVPVTDCFDQLVESLGLNSVNKELSSVSTGNFDSVLASSGVPSTTASSLQSPAQPKVTCKYEIDFFDDEAARVFLLAKRIIGPKGSNMKKIIEACFEDRPFEPDALKLRLRGKGSGFREGPQNRECNEPLHLCISAKSQLFYERSTKLIEQLLFDVCKTFENFIVKNNMLDLLRSYGPDAVPVRLFKKESAHGGRPELIHPSKPAPHSLQKDKKAKKPLAARR